VASHYQDISSKNAVIAYLKANGMSPFAPNFTITKMGNHPDVKGNGFVPYYIIFDHTGKLISHHMCGSYHGGDGWRMIEIVDELLEKAPAIYLGAEPYEKIAPLAARVSKGKALGGSVKKIDAKLASEPDAATKAELERLMGLVTKYRDRKMGYAEALEGKHPAGVIPTLKQLSKTFKGTSLAAAVDEKLTEMGDSDTLKDQVAIEKSFLKISKAYEKTKEKRRTDAYIAKTVKKLEKLIEGKDHLPYAATVEAFLADLR